MTAGEARASARAVAGELTDAVGDLTGRAVAVQLPNGPELVTTMVGVWLAGGVYVPVNPRFPRAEVDLVLDTTRPAALVTEAGIEVLAAAAGPPRQSPSEVDQLYEPGVAFVMWTSGTTGRPKAVRHTHEAYLELLDRVLTPLRGPKGSTDPGSAAVSLPGARTRRPSAEPHPQPDPGVDGAQRRSLQRPVRAARRGGAGDDGSLRAPPLRRAGAPLRDPLDRAASRGDGDADRLRRHRPGSVALRAVDHRARCRRCRPDGSPTGSRCSCSTGTARPRSAR